ncbi:uncharacterized protein A4U43_C03F31610 [Asparagus officinalis]|uniref:Uncharacterized protein n=1 Tax=Asparagus officinalis TaxID=4686 RepID=A0A5P1FIL2_ASPOF|nr:uncharacterized protein A4U43_C03F31610 [Asparagus officinalis]
MTVIWRVVSLAWSKRKLAYPIDDRELNEYDSSRVAHTQQYRHEYKAQNLDWKNDQVEASSESKGQRNGDDGVKQVIDEVQEFV